MELQKGQSTSGIFCPKCSELVFHDPAIIVLEIFCPECEEFVAIPPPEPGLVMYCTKVDANSVTFEMPDGRNIPFINEP